MLTMTLWLRGATGLVWMVVWGSLEVQTGASRWCCPVVAGIIGLVGCQLRRSFLAFERRFTLTLTSPCNYQPLSLFHTNATILIV
ncbi:hypothetical protein QBC38DRAFT_484947 [Podospora fimiseda]|uniref:Uncharacterized protein n=1 Tax=Podospora fimiseda TaxID=252190 RepID=A0AAN7GUL0_9PEZI|nr:hypothetical protein QBC38DRAFT_484947 [Podospora fimiseda]